MPAHDPIALGLSLPLGSVVPFAGLLLSIAPLPLFAGIFATMIPALPILKARGAALGVVSPAHFFWATGALSSFLDNAPTYLAFFSLAQGVGGGATGGGGVGPAPAGDRRGRGLHGGQLVLPIFALLTLIFF